MLPFKIGRFNGHERGAHFFHGPLQDLASRFLPFPSFLLCPFFFPLFTSRSFPSQWGCPASESFTMRAKFDALPLSESCPRSGALSSSDSETLTEGDRPIRAHKGEGIRNNEATMNRRAPCCLSPAVLLRFVGTLFIYFPTTYLTSRPPPRGQRFSSFPLRPSVTKIGNLIGSRMDRY